MAAETYSFIDIAALPELRERFAAGEALLLLSADLGTVLWVNGPGAAAFASSGIDALTDGPSPLGTVARRQIGALPGFPALGEGRGVAVRVASGMTSRILSCHVRSVALPDGASAILLASPAGAPDAARAIAGIAQEGQFAAMLDGEGNVLAASAGFAELGLSPRLMKLLMADAVSRPGGFVKRKIEAGGRVVPAGLVRLTDTANLVIVVDEGFVELDDDVLSPDAAEAFEADGGEALAVLPDADSAGPGSGEPEAGLEIVLPHEIEEDWYFNGAGDAASEPKARLAELSRSAPVRFSWRTDPDGRFTAVSPEFLDAVELTEREVLGEPWSVLAARFGFDRDGEIAARLSGRDTWSGSTVLWPLAYSQLLVPVDFAALPTFNRARAFEGFRGFGVARLADAVMRPDEEPAPDAGSEGPPAVPEPAEAEEPGVEPSPPAAPPEASASLKDQSDHILRLLSEQRQPAGEKALSPNERNAFQEIGKRLKGSETTASQTVAEALPAALEARPAGPRDVATPTPTEDTPAAAPSEEAKPVWSSQAASEAAGGIGPDEVLSGEEPAEGRSEEPALGTDFEPAVSGPRDGEATPVAASGDAAPAAGLPTEEPSEAPEQAIVPPEDAAPGSPRDQTDDALLYEFAPEAPGTDDAPVAGAEDSEQDSVEPMRSEAAEATRADAVPESFVAAQEPAGDAETTEEPRPEADGSAVDRLPGQGVGTVPAEASPEPSSGWDADDAREATADRSGSEPASAEEDVEAAQPDAVADTVPAGQEPDGEMEAPEQSDPAIGTAAIDRPAEQHEGAALEPSETDIGAVAESDDAERPVVEATDEEAVEDRQSDAVAYSLFAGREAQESGPEAGDDAVSSPQDQEDEAAPVEPVAEAGGADAGLPHEDAAVETVEPSQQAGEGQERSDADADPSVSDPEVSQREPKVEGAIEASWLEPVPTRLEEPGGVATGEWQAEPGPVSRGEAEEELPSSERESDGVTAGERQAEPASVSNGEAEEEHQSFEREAPEGEAAGEIEAEPQPFEGLGLVSSEEAPPETGETADEAPEAGGDAEEIVSDSEADAPSVADETSAAAWPQWLAEERDAPPVAAIRLPEVPAATATGMAPDMAAESQTRGDAASAPDTTVLEELPLALLVHAGDRLHYANPEFLALSGYPSLDAFGEAGGLGALFGEAPAGGDRLTLQPGSGTAFPVETLLRSVPWGEGKALMLVLRRVEEESAQAIAPQTPAVPASAPVQEDAAARLAELRAIVDTATDGVVVIAPDLSVRSLSRPAEALFGIDSGEAAGKPFGALFAAESQRTVADYLDGLADNGVASVLNDGREVIGRERSGGAIPLFMTIGTLPEKNGFCAVLRDITQWKRAEEELTQSRALAERASSHKTEFLARVSHEIRTPLNAIIGFSELMLDEKFGPVGSDRYRDYLRDINRSGNHVLALVNDLLDISKIEAGQQEMAYEAVSLNDALTETVATMQPQANRERVIIRSSLAPDLPEVVADHRSVRQIALNILSNAIRFTPAGGQVIVSTAIESSGDVVLRVRDTGIGMSQAEIEQALKPFKQINSLTHRRTDGTGLGLPLTKAMVEANRARFAIASTPGEGTLVEVVFPSTRVLA